MKVLRVWSREFHYTVKGLIAWIMLTCTLFTFGFWMYIMGLPIIGRYLKTKGK